MAACEVHGSKLTDPRSVVTQRFSSAQWSKGCKTPTTYRLEGPALSHPSPAGLWSLHARQGHRWPWLKWTRCLWTWGTPGELNHKAESDGPQDPPRRTGALTRLQETVPVEHRDPAQGLWWPGLLQQGLGVKCNTHLIPPRVGGNAGTSLEKWCS